MPSNSEYKAVAAILERSERVLITTHIKPDGDACGCVRALTEHLRSAGKTVYPLMLSPLASWYAELFDEAVPVLGNDVMSESLLSVYGACDTLVIVDTNSLIQLPGLEGYISASRASGSLRIVVIDHHVTGDHLGDVELIDSQAAADRKSVV